MTTYRFVRANNVQGHLATNALGTDVLNALGAIVQGGNALNYDARKLTQGEDENGEWVQLDVTGTPTWEAGTVLAEHGVAIGAKTV